MGKWVLWDKDGYLDESGYFEEDDEITERFEKQDDGSYRLK